MKEKVTVSLPAEVAQIAENVSVEKRNEVQTVLNHVFNGVAKMREQLDSVSVTDEGDKVNMKLANTIRLGVRQVRLDSEKTFDQKRAEVQQRMLSYKTEDSLWLKAKQTMQILTKEIEENARWKEETKARFDAEQKELVIQQRVVRLTAVAPDMDRSEFENMSDETFEIFFSGIEKAHVERIEAELKAEKERVAKEKAETKRIEDQRVENERLKKEAEAREKAIEKEREENAKKLAEQQRIAKAEADKIESERKKEAEAREKLEIELKAKKDAEAKVEAGRIAKEKSDAKAPIEEKMNAWVNGFIISSAPIENETTKEILEKFNGFKKWALTKISQS